MATALLITNPAAARTEPLAVNIVRDALRTAGWRTELVATGGPGDARRLAEYGVQEGVDLVAVFGGDGTTMQAAAALVGTPVAPSAGSVCTTTGGTVSTAKPVVK